MSIVDHIQEAKDRVITQYRESVTLSDYLEAVLIEANELEQVYCDLILKRFIDTAEGINLDIIGQLVGQPRILIDAAFLEFFGFEGQPNAGTFGTHTNPAIGAPWRSHTQSETGNVQLNDSAYRLFIRARIIKNNTRATHEEIIEMVLFIFDTVTDVEITEGDRAYLVNIGGALTGNEQALLISTDLMPKPIGIRVNYAFHPPDNEGFSLTSALDGTLGTGKGLGTVVDPLIGGTLSTIIT